MELSGNSDTVNNTRSPISSNPALLAAYGGAVWRIRLKRAISFFGRPRTVVVQNMFPNSFLNYRAVQKDVGLYMSSIQIDGQ